MKKIFLSLIFVYSLLTTIYGQAYYDKSGQAILHFNIDKNTFFSYDGKPIFYLKYDSYNSETNIYNFDGQHIGWYSSERLYNHDGSIFLFTKNSGVNILFQMEPLKGLEQLQPLKKLESMPPMKPLFKNSVVSTYIPGTSSTTQNTNPYNRAPDYDSYKTEGYHLPTNAILGAIEAQTNYQIEMMRRGYVLDPSSGTYMTKEAYSEREQQRVAYEAYKQAEVIEGINTLVAFANSKDISFDPDKLKTGWYILPGVGDINGKLMSILCKIKKGTITRILLRSQNGRYSWKCNYLIKNKIQRIDLTNKTTYTKGYFFYTLGIKKG